MIGSISLPGGSAWSQTGQVGFSAMHQQRGERMFREMDADGNGSVSKDEFVSWDEQMRSRMSQAEDAGDLPSAEDIFAQLDADEDGELSSAELAAMGRAAGGPPPGPPPGSDGQESAGVISDLLDALNQDSSSSGAKVRSALDTDGDGTVSIEELLAGLKGYAVSLQRSAAVGQGGMLNFVA